MFEFIRDFEEIYQATTINCGNYLDMDLKMAKLYSQKFLDDILYKIDEEHLNYTV